MILVSFSSGEDALSNDVKIYHTFSSQGTETQPFCSFGDTRYMVFQSNTASRIQNEIVCDFIWDKI